MTAPAEPVAGDPPTEPAMTLNAGGVPPDGRCSRIVSHSARWSRVADAGQTGRVEAVMIRRLLKLLIVSCALVSSCDSSAAMVNARVESIKQDSPPRACLRTFDKDLPDRGCYRFAPDEADLLRPGACLWVKIPSDADPEPEFADQPLQDISLADEDRC